MIAEEKTKSTPVSGKAKKKRDSASLRKAPQAPKRFKSSYIIFFMAKQNEIKSQLDPKSTSAPEVSRRASELWKSLTPEERSYWDAEAEKDKERFMSEKANYTGPWQVPYKRSKKDPSAPKRNPSAFLLFSQDKRQQLKREHKNMKNTEVSRILGDIWRNELSEEDKRPFFEQEERERAIYKRDMIEWKRQDAIRKEHQKIPQVQEFRVNHDRSTNDYCPSMRLPVEETSLPYYQEGPYEEQTNSYYNNQYHQSYQQRDCGPLSSHRPGPYHALTLNSHPSHHNEAPDTNILDAQCISYPEQIQPGWYDSQNPRSAEFPSFNNEQPMPMTFQRGNCHTQDQNLEHQAYSVNYNHEHYQESGTLYQDKSSDYDPYPLHY